MPSGRTNRLLRLCVKSVTDREGADRDAVSKAFAVCTANFQKHGYMDGTELTKKGLARLRKKQREPGYGEKLGGYEKALATARENNEGMLTRMRVAIDE